MTTIDRFEDLSARLALAVRAHDDIGGLVLLGSASDEGAARRDEWSDHDFFALIEAGRGDIVRPDLSWLPDQPRLVLTAREGEIGFVALYDDGHVFEFAFSEVGELAGAVAGEATVVLDDAAGSAAALIARARATAAASDRFDAENDVRLVLVKLLIGVGRVRRGEVLNGGDLVRSAAVKHLIRAIRGRFDLSTTLRDAIDPVRRFESDFPEWGSRIAEIIAVAPEDAAHGLFLFNREVLEPGWSGYPSRAADAVAARLGW